MTPPCVVPTFRPYAAENLEFGGFYASSCESRANSGSPEKGAASGVLASGSERPLSKHAHIGAGQIGNDPFPPDPADLRAEDGRRLWGKKSSPVERRQLVQ